MHVKLYLTNQAEEWRSYVDRLPEGLRDVHFLPEMMVPYEEARMGRGMLLVDESDENHFLIQPLLRLANGELRHPYNFGGPIATPDHINLPGLRGPVFCTLNPFLAEAQKALVGEVEYVKDVVWADLTEPVKLRSTTRHCVAKAEKAGACFREDRSHKAVTFFSKIYDEVMARNKAAPHWRFSPVWFAAFMRALDQNATMFLVYYGEEPQAACILLHGYGTCYYHFAASRDCENANHFMVAKAIEWARDKGYKRFHLGGGVQSNDGLYRFKAGFSDLRAPVYKYQKDGGAQWAARIPA